MSCIRVNLSDGVRTISGDVHGSMTDALIASLTADPETIEEFELALERFVRTESDWKALRGFVGHEDLEPYDAGILAIDLAARVIGVESTYSIPSMEGTVRVASEFGDDTDNGYVYVPYKLPDDWLILHSIDFFEGSIPGRRKKRTENAPFDARPVLFGKPLIEFLLREIKAAEDIEDPDLFTKIHAKWLMTSREDLRGKTPREVLLERQKHISFDLHSRALQYSFTKICPPPIATDSNAYKRAGFGVHEAVMYYDLVRHLLSFCDMNRRLLSDENEEEATNELIALKNRWLNSPDPESGRMPATVIETERRRLNLTTTAHDLLIDEDCPCCIAMSEDFDTPGFWHYDASGMDDRFEFSFHRTREEWDEEQRQYEQWSREFEETRARGEIPAYNAPEDGEDPF